MPKIEEPTEEVVDLYHTMYIKSLQCLFDKYKTRFGLKESDVLQIQWKDEMTVLNLWTAAEPWAPFPALVPGLD